MPLSFRRAGLNDFDAVYDLLKELVGTIDVIRGDAGRARFQELLSHPGTQVMVAESAGVLVGTATLHVLPNMTFSGRSYALVENVVTLKSAQGQGVGAALCSMCWILRGMRGVIR